MCRRTSNGGFELNITSIPSTHSVSFLQPQSMGGYHVSFNFNDILIDVRDAPIPLSVNKLIMMYIALLTDNV